jgi:acyl-coenzyme A thioesterase PaaI-like protein
LQGEEGAQVEWLRDDAYCYVCGKENESGLRLDVEFADGVARLTTRLGREFQGWEGIIHGGFVSMLLDEAMAHAVGRTIGPGMTVRLSVSFKSALKVDEEVEVSGRLVERRSRAGVAEAEMRSTADQRLIATGRSEFIIRKGTRCEHLDQARPACNGD